MKDTSIFILMVLLLISMGCKGTKKEKVKKSGIVKEIVELPSGKKIERTRVGSDSDKEKMEKAMTTTIEGKIEMVSMHPNPESLEPVEKSAAYFVVIIPDEGEMIFPLGVKTTILRRHAGKRVTIVGVRRRKAVKFGGKTYPAYELKEIKRIK